jgi:hypothetical protein
VQTTRTPPLVRHSGAAAMAAVARSGKACRTLLVRNQQKGFAAGVQARCRLHYSAPVADVVSLFKCFGCVGLPPDIFSAKFGRWFANWAGEPSRGFWKPRQLLTYL